MTKSSINITHAQIEQYKKDGAIVLRNVIDQRWIDLGRTAIDYILNHPNKASTEYTPEGKKGRYYGDLFACFTNTDLLNIMKSSEAPEIAAMMMETDNVWYFYDQLLVKEPNTAEPTPWHHDLPYWPIRGKDIISIWMPFDEATVETGVVTYIKGSHKWGKFYAPKGFSSKSKFNKSYKENYKIEECPDFSDTLDQYDTLTETLSPGDVLIHHPLTVHYSRGNSSANIRRRALALRYVGPDCVWDGRPGTFMSNPDVISTLPEPVRLKDGESLSDQENVFLKVH